MPAFARTIGIDYSGAEKPTSGLKGLRVYLVEGDAPPIEVQPPSSAKKYWTRRGIAEWLVERLAEDIPTLVGIDHGFSFPLRYFEVHGLLLASQFGSRAYRVPISCEKELGMFAKSAVKPLKKLVPLR